MSDYNGSLQRFRQTVLFRRIEFWFDTEVFEDILMGNGECVSSDQTGPVPVDPFYIIFTLHTLLQEDRLSNEMINTVFRKIHITRNNICIFLDYVYRFIDYKKKSYPRCARSRYQQYPTPNTQSARALLRSGVLPELLEIHLG